VAQLALSARLGDGDRAASSTSSTGHPRAVDRPAVGGEPCRPGVQRDDRHEAPERVAERDDALGVGLPRWWNGPIAVRRSCSQ